MAQTVADLMVKDVLTVEPSDTIGEMPELATQPTPAEIEAAGGLYEPTAPLGVETS